MSEITSILTALKAAEGTEAALATLVAVAGSSYRRPGARALILPGRRVGSISGGCLEEDVRLRAERVLATGNPELVTYDTTPDNDLTWGMNLGCPGVIQVFIERVPAARPSWMRALMGNTEAGRPTDLGIVYGGVPPAAQGTFLAAELPPAAPAAQIFRERVEPPQPLVVFGAGDDAVPLVRMAKVLGWRVTLVDSRRAMANCDRFPEADAVIVTLPASMDEHVGFDAGSYAVVMTHRFAEDLELLRILLARPIRYLGLIGSRGRAQRLLGRLRHEGATLDPTALEALRAPVGLDLGATNPEAIALSILAEMQCCQSGHAPVPLRDRAGSIHG